MELLDLPDEMLELISRFLKEEEYYDNFRSSSRILYDLLPVSNSQDILIDIREFRCERLEKIKKLELGDSLTFFRFDRYVKIELDNNYNLKINNLLYKLKLNKENLNKIRIYMDDIGNLELFFKNKYYKIQNITYEKYDLRYYDHDDFSYHRLNYEKRKYLQGSRVVYEKYKFSSNIVNYIYPNYIITKTDAYNLDQQYEKRVDFYKNIKMYCFYRMEKKEECLFKTFILVYIYGNLTKLLYFGEFINRSAFGQKFRNYIYKEENNKKLVTNYELINKYKHYKNYDYLHMIYDKKKLEQLSTLLDKEII